MKREKGKKGKSEYINQKKFSQLYQGGKNKVKKEEKRQITLCFYKNEPKKSPIFPNYTEKIINSKNLKKFIHTHTHSFPPLHTHTSSSSKNIIIIINPFSPPHRHTHTHTQYINESTY